MRKVLMIIYMLLFLTLLLSCFMGCNNSIDEMPSILPTETTKLHTIASEDNKYIESFSTLKTAILIVNGKQMSEKDYAGIDYKNQYGVLPLVSVSEELGVTVKWQSDTTAVLSYQGIEYFLDIENCTLVNKEAMATIDHPFNIIDLPPGTSHSSFFRFVHNDLIIDSSSMCHYMYMLDAEIEIDYDAGIIVVENKKTE